MARLFQALIWLTLSCVIAFAQPAGQGVISGTVVDTVSGDAVNRAIVTVTWHGTPRSWATVRTDGSGRFTFQGLPAGKYDLKATKNGVGTATYGARNLRELGDLITLGPGEIRSDLKLLFLHSASVFGRVIDRDGDPVRNAQVSLLRSGRNLGEKILVNYRQTSSDDHGDFRIPQVDAGEYYLVCKPVFQNATADVAQEILVDQYFPGARDSKDARMLTIRGGEVLSGFDFHLDSERPAKITGHIVGVPQLDPPNPLNGGVAGSIPGGVGVRPTRINRGQLVSVNLSPADNGQFWSQGTGANGPDYHFEFPSFAPGRYRVQATVQVKEKTYYATQTFSAAAGLTNLVLTMAPGVEIKGHLKVEGPAQRTSASFTIALAPPPASGGRNEGWSAPVAKDGSFKIENVPPGEWMLNVNPSGPNNAGPNGGNPNAGTTFFEKSVRLGELDVLYKRLEIPPGFESSLEIVESSNTSIVEGEVDTGGADAKRASIILGPIGTLHNLARFYYSVPVDDDGKFKINGVAPGKYKIFALENIAAANYRNPESTELLDALGEELEVREGSKVESRPKLIREDKVKEILQP
jgi:hypothetical protein